MLSVIIPARNEPYLEQTIRNVLDNAEGKIEVLVELDGYKPEITISDSRVRFFHNEEALGQRGAINHAARQAQGDYVMKLDAHCAVGKGFDVILASDCEPDWTVIPRMYNLDHTTFKPKLFDDFNRAIRMRKLHDYIGIHINEKDEFRVWYMPHGFNKELHHSRKDILIDDAMACMGCCFFMTRERFWELEGCDEGHGSWGNQGIEVALKAWLSGGSLKVNKNTWFAHWFRAGDGGFPYPISGNAIDRARSYSRNLWTNNRWHKQTRPISWLFEKFKYPGWEAWVENTPEARIASSGLN